MKQYDADKPLISLHVPKCGGISFRSVLEQWFGANLYLHYFAGLLGEERPQQQELSSGTCVHGHFSRTRKTEVLDYYPEVDQFITILRDPFEMMVSYYFYAKRLGENRFRDGKRLPPIREKFQGIGDFFKKRHRTYALVKFLPYEVTLDNYEEMFEKYFVYVGITEDRKSVV